jgi:DNA repair protein RadC
MRDILTILLFFLTASLNGQTHIERISEKSDTMALINKHDISIINKVFEDRYLLDSLRIVNDQLILQLQIENQVKSTIIDDQNKIIENNKFVIKELETNSLNIRNVYEKEIRCEKNKKIVFQTTTGISFIAIILILLL